VTDAAPRRVLVLGGARSGKSLAAENLLAGEASVDYIATARSDPADAEWGERIARHREQRPSHWRTVETTDLAGVLSDGAGAEAALIDSITAWLSHVVDAAGAWEHTPAAREHLAQQVDLVIGAWAATGRRVVAVSDEVGSGIVPDNAAARMFRDALGLLNQRLAASADEVWLVVAGIPTRLR
jgi:adenosylcobinamide kinase / adenosylcobinamide-phosphate guanylyltransferase